MKTQQEQVRLAAFRRRALRAAPGWLPPPEEREEINEVVLEKCLGIKPESTVPGKMTPEQRLEIAARWFAGEEAKIPYEEWGLERPSWIGRP